MTKLLTVFLSDSKMEALFELPTEPDPQGTLDFLQTLGPSKLAKAMALLSGHQDLQPSQERELAWLVSNTISALQNLLTSANSCSPIEE